MRIFNVMMCRDLGGIQQAFVDYEQALLTEGHEVINITSKKADIHHFIKSSHTLPNLTSWCFLSKIILRKLVQRYKPDLIIVHGGRASSFASAWKVPGVPVVGITHNYSHKRLKDCDYVIYLTKDLRNHMLQEGYPVERLYSVPNMIEVDKQYVPKIYREPIIVGTYGRFVENKGFHHFILAAKQVVEKGLNVKFKIGGDGEEGQELRSLVEDLGLKDIVTFSGWVDNKDEFFESIDVFCCPSEHEPFGIVILEAMKHSTPIVATMSQGPSEILEDEKDALLAANKSPDDIAEKLIRIITEEELARRLAKSAYKKVKSDYDAPAVALKLSAILADIKQAK